MKNIGAKFFQLAANESDMALKKRIVFQIFIHFEMTEASVLVKQK